MNSISLSDVMTQANELSLTGQLEAAIQCYQSWLATPESESEHHYIALFNMGVLLRSAGQNDAAIVAYQGSLKLRPDFYQAAVNLGLALEAQGRPEAAMAIWESALQPIEGQTLLLNHLGRSLENARFYAQAENKLERSLQLNPHQPDAIQHYFHLRQKQCEWPVIKSLPGLSEQELLDSFGPLGLLALSDDPGLQARAVQSWIARKLPTDLPRLSPIDGYQHKRLRIGYMSCDFRWHAVSILTAELFELHDREQFEIYGIDFSVDDGGSMRKRVISAMDHHLPIQTLNDEDAAQLIRAHEIDILIDLTGLTSGARYPILAYKPAPIQISYLGFVGSCGMPQIDYILVDRFVFPEELALFYLEKPLYLPEVYQSNDSQREIGATPSREVCQLPADGFVYCSFNGSYKITPEVFAVWMRILKRVPHSVLWLVADNPWAQQNLSDQAHKHGIDPNRLVFAERVAPAEYLARYRVADLLLDTSPYNAGTTASDALWAGLPVLTCPGRTFASRMAGSLLNAVGLNELIAADWLAYENKAVQLALQPEELANYRQRLASSAKSSPLFDTRRFVRNLEATLKLAMHINPLSSQ
ncbi:MAG: tetratricopeptide repeat protein [Methylovulum sp.]|nr:tetratricopeptide repeat protein [Methylovulum sp.]MCF7997999.1 tetratricopeptide repeat protein [Methylovulum sp.]